jgi:hypothetical protein
MGFRVPKKRKREKKWGRKAENTEKRKCARKKNPDTRGKKEKNANERGSELCESGRSTRDRHLGELNGPCSVAPELERGGADGAHGAAAAAAEHGGVSDRGFFDDMVKKVTNAAKSAGNTVVGGAKSTVDAAKKHRRYACYRS